MQSSPFRSACTCLGCGEEPLGGAPSFPPASILGSALASVATVAFGGAVDADNSSNLTGAMGMRRVSLFGLGGLWMDW